jgi:glycosyltransferase involved in cell wall biosynthesis
VIERHAVLLFAYDQVREQYNLTVQTIETILAQDIGNLELLLIDNGSTQVETFQHFQMIRDLYWERDEGTRIHIARNKENISPVKVCNRALDYLWKRGHEKVLCVANDVMLPPNAYRLMNEFPRGMVCASMTEQKDYPILDSATAVNCCTPMALGLVRKWAYDALVAKDGYYLDEGFFHYASDNDLALRMSSCGIVGVQLDLQYWHSGSASWKLLSEPEGRKLTNQADVDRSYFVAKWGHSVTDEQYTRSALDINFKGIPLTRKAVSA